MPRYEVIESESVEDPTFPPAYVVIDHTIDDAVAIFDDRADAEALVAQLGGAHDPVVAAVGGGGGIPATDGHGSRADALAQEATVLQLDLDVAKALIADLIRTIPEQAMPCTCQFCTSNKALIARAADLGVKVPRG